MPVAFGTSGLRGESVDFTDNVCMVYVSAFLQHLSHNFSYETVYVGADLRESSPKITISCYRAIELTGRRAIWAGNVPTPALAAYAMAPNAPAIMITGSHIPEAYNGIKFYRPDGEFLKDDEAPVRGLAEELLSKVVDGQRSVNLPAPLADVAEEYVSRSIGAFGRDTLAGMKIGIDLHSAVGRDILVRIFKGLGAEVYPFRRTENFVAVDTEALDPADISRARTFIAEHGLDAVVSTDGDGDRPLVIDDQGRQVNGDTLGNSDGSIFPCENSRDAAQYDERTRGEWLVREYPQNTDWVALCCGRNGACGGASSCWFRGEWRLSTRRRCGVEDWFIAPPPNAGCSFASSGCSCAGERPGYAIE